MTEARAGKTSRRRTARLTVASVTVVGGLVFAATGWAAALSTNPSRSSQVTSSTASPHPWPWRDHDGWGSGWSGGFWNALHGECVTAKSGGGTETMLFQRGTVTDVSGTSVTVLSSDGFSQRYAVASDVPINGEYKGGSTIAKNKKVMIIALKGSGTPTTKHVFVTD